jgi:hypothetical protein
MAGRSAETRKSRRFRLRIACYAKPDLANAAKLKPRSLTAAISAVRLELRPSPHRKNFAPVWRGLQRCRALYQRAAQGGVAGDLSACCHPSAAKPRLRTATFQKKDAPVQSCRSAFDRCNGCHVGFHRINDAPTGADENLQRGKITLCRALIHASHACLNDAAREAYLQKRWAEERKPLWADAVIDFNRHLR